VIISLNIFLAKSFKVKKKLDIIVVDPGKGVCADPVNRDAILEKGGTGPGGGDKERQCSLDREGDKT
jgi:hypothetical protein